MKYLSAWLEIRQIEEKGDQMSQADKLKRLKRAHKIFEGLTEDHPDWKSTLVHERMDAARKAIGTIEGGATK